MDLKQYAQLARIGVADQELDELEGEIEDILDYVEQIQEVTDENIEKSVGRHYNILREDTDPHASGTFTEALLDEAPKTQGQYVKVKKIL